MSHCLLSELLLPYNLTYALSNMRRSINVDYLDFVIEQVWYLIITVYDTAPPFDKILCLFISYFQLIRTYSSP